MNKPSGHFRLLAVSGAVFVVVLYLVLACGLALTKRPWCDEACFSNPGVDLITRGTMGFTAMDPTGYGILVGWVFTRVQTHAYFIMPFDPVLQAAWFKLFGVHVFTMRSLHVLLGLTALLAWGFLVRRLSGSGTAALLAMGLVALDRGFLQAASDGRADMSSAAFGVLGIATYMALRERRLAVAILAANAFLTAAVLCHPIGGIAGLGLIYLAFRFDRHRLVWRHIPVAAMPYVIGFGLWGWYISLDPEAFRMQFLANASTGRFGGLSSPLLGFWREITVRYLERSYLPPYVHGWRAFPVLIPCLYALGVLMCLFAPGMRVNPAARLFGRWALLYFGVFSVLEGTKPDFYLVHTTPLLCCCLALWIHVWWSRPGWRRYVAATSVCTVAVLGLGWSAYTIRRNPYRESYIAVTNFIKKHAAPGALTMGGGELGFELGFYGPVLDDATLGYYSGRRPDFIVIDDKCYRGSIENLAAKAPPVYRYVMKVLREDCDKVFTSGTCVVYARKGVVRFP